MPYPGYNNIRGYMDNGELAWLYETAKEMCSIIEIGCLMGRSTHALLSGCPGIVYAVDHFEGSPEHEYLRAEGFNFYEEFKKNTKQFDNLIICKGSSREMAQVPWIPRQVDMVFIDGAHDLDAVLFDIREWGLRAKKLLCGHDRNFMAVPQAIKETIGSFDYDISTIWAKWQNQG